MVARNGWIELVRIAAAFGIVWFHSGYAPGRAMAYAGLSAFIVLTACFETAGASAKGLMPTVSRYAVPWVVWTVLYGAINLAQHQPVTRTPGIAGMLYGTSPHLWYLPFIGLAVCAIRSFRRFIVVPAAVVLILLLLTTPQWRTGVEHLAPPLPQYAYSLVPLMFGIVLAHHDRRWTIVAVASVALMAIGLASTGIGISYIIGCGVVGLIVRATATSRVPAPLRAIGGAAPLMFGVYLIHPMFLAVLRIVSIDGVGRIVGAFLLSVLLSWGLRMTAIGRRIA